VGLEIYGGNPQIVASYEDMQRAATQLELAADKLQEAIFIPQDLILEIFPNPIPQLQLLFALPGLIERVRLLSQKTRFAAEGYFSTEARVILALQQALEPIHERSQILANANPISQAVAEKLRQSAAALAVIGLTGAPSLGKTALVATAGTLLASAGGHSAPASMARNLNATALALGMPQDHKGSAELSKIEPIRTASSFAEHARRLHGLYAESSTIAVEVYNHGYGRQFVVYIPGTQSFSLGGDNPLNIRSGIAGLGGAITSSQEAVQAALAQLQAGKGDRVLFIGHSQGALIAGNLAQSVQPYEVSGLISFGGPISQLSLDVPTIAISHEGDPVSTLGGGVNPMRENWVTVSGDAEFKTMVDAHRMSGYEITAAELDSSKDEGFRRVQSMLWQEESGGLKYSFAIKRG
jgi:predicted esterase